MIDMVAPADDEESRMSTGWIEMDMLRSFCQLRRTVLPMAIALIYGYLPHVRCRSRHVSQRCTVKKMDPIGVRFIVFLPG